MLLGQASCGTDSSKIFPPRQSAACVLRRPAAYQTDLEYDGQISGSEIQGAFIKKTFPGTVHEIWDNFISEMNHQNPGLFQKIRDVWPP